MRNALGLMLMTVAAAVVITGVWFWTSHRSSAAPQTIADAHAVFTPPPSKPAKPAASRDPVEITGSIADKAPPVPALLPK